MYKTLIDEQYIRTVSGRLDQFRQVSAHKFNCRCPVCGDSQKSRTKARFYMYVHSSGDGYVVKCHNCDYTNSFDKFLEVYDPGLHREYVLECVRVRSDGVERKDDVETVIEPTKTFKTDPVDGLKRISQLKHNHLAKRYIDWRMIPPNEHYRLYYTPSFKAWTNQHVPGKFTEKSCKHDFPAVVIPIRFEDGSITGWQGHPLVKNPPVKYITIIVNEAAPRLFGLELINDDDSDVYVFEGPFDSMFIHNGLASCGGYVTSDLSKTSIKKERIIVVYDNESRHPDTINKMTEALDAGYRISLWPDDVKLKDVNDLVRKGHMSPAQVKQIIDSNVTSGMEGKLKLSYWSKL